MALRHFRDLFQLQNLRSSLFLVSLRTGIMDVL